MRQAGTISRPSRTVARPCSKSASINSRRDIIAAAVLLLHTILRRNTYEITVIIPLLPGNARHDNHHIFILITGVYTMQNIVTLGRRLIPIEHIAFVEPFDPAANSQFKTDKAYKARVVLIN